MDKFIGVWQDTGIYQMLPGQGLMILVGLLLLYLAIRKGFEPLLLLPIGFGTILVNIPGAGFMDAPIFEAGHLVSPGGFLYYIYSAGIETGVFPLYEIENGKYKMSLELPKLRPIQDYMRLQGRFRHLSEDTIKEIQERVIREYERVKEKAR